MPIEVLKQIWPEWTIGKRIGGGAYGTVYEASRSEYGVDNHAAIKIISIPTSEAEIDALRAEGLDMQGTKAHFQTIIDECVKEIGLMVALEGSPNIVNVKDYKVVEKKDAFGWYIFILMERLTPFAEYTADRQLSEEEVIKLGCDICTALEICAGENIIHRDVKPGNILVHKSGEFKLGDFGIARKLENMTGGLSQRYTPKYMAPEMATRSDYDGRVDIYSLGIVLYELLNGRRIPFQENKQIRSFAEIDHAVRRRNSGEALPAPSNASPAMADLILRACAYDPNMRFSSAAEMKKALKSVANGTYPLAAGNLEGTVSVRKAPNGDDQTTIARRPPAQGKDNPPPAVNTFDSQPQKKNKRPSVMAAALAAVLLIIVGCFAVPKLFDGKESAEPEETSGQSASETSVYSKFDREQIASILSEAEGLAGEEDYEGALVKVQTGLVTYPKSAELQDKAEEYSDALNAQIKRKTLDEAEMLAAAGDYASAVALLQNAQETQGDDADYQNALQTYTAEMEKAMEPPAVSENTDAPPAAETETPAESLREVLFTGTVSGYSSQTAYQTPGGTEMAGRFDQGDQVSVSEITFVNGMTWCKTERGWISLNSVDPNFAPKGTRFGIVTGNWLNIRTGPSADSPKIAEYKKGAKVLILGEDTVGGTRWARTDAGWVTAQYVDNLYTPEADTPVFVEQFIKPNESRAYIQYTRDDFFYASSSMTDSTQVYPADKAFDGDLSTAWVEGVPGYGVGESIRVTFSKPTLLQGVAICGGYQLSEYLYNADSRPKTLAVNISNEIYMTLYLDDYYGLQEFPFGSSITADFVEFTITDVYPGKQNADTCIAEIKFY